MQKLRLATAGAGYFSQFHFDAWQRIPEVELVGVCNQTVEKAQSIVDTFGGAAFSDFQKMVNEVRPNIVDVITPPETHDAYVTAALHAGAHVICQKPFTANLATAGRLAALAREKGLRLVVHENFRFQPWYRKIKSELDAGRVGQVYQLRFCLRPGDGQGPDAYLARQPYFQKMPRFLIHETGVHWVDTFRYLLGRPQCVFADLRQLNPAIAGEDAGLVLFTYEDNRRAILDGNRLSDHVAENRRRTMGEMLIEGEKGTLLLTGDGAVRFRAFGSNEWQELPYDWQDKGFGGDCVYALQRHAIEGILKKQPIENEAFEYLDVIVAEAAIYESADTGRLVPIG